jgi:hypothetical protein
MRGTVVSSLWPDLVLFSEYNNLIKQVSSIPEGTGINYSLKKRDKPLWGAVDEPYGYH